MGTRDDRPQAMVTQAPHDAQEPILLRDLAAGFAHDLNQPLAAIAAYADGAATLLRRGDGHAPRALHILEAIANQALRAGALVQHLRGAAGPAGAPGAALDPNELLRRMEPLLARLAARRDVRLVVELRTPLPPVKGDSERLTGLLLLLFGTALDTVSSGPAPRHYVVLATEAGAGTVELSATGPRGILFHLQLPQASLA